ncbi:GNAT family N-acetyltransferase [Kitasatospora sp. NPDC059571]|uniref:GNAT family N-acetyltransferase n=1 Tax=Kitasatospora sp. NPDC059571 TaxID=3346871 RepID=UPI0036AF1930
MTVPLDARHFTDLAGVRDTLIEVYADVRAPLLHLPNYAVHAFAERLDRQGAEPGFEAVIGFVEGEAVGYAFGNSVGPGNLWWTRMAGPLPDHITRVPTLALREIGVREPWRGTGLARRIHDALLRHRTEPQVSLMVNPAAGDGKVLARYESWGYRAINEVQPHPDSPPLVAMLRNCVR